MTTYDKFVKQGFEQGLEQVKVIIKQIIIMFPEMTDVEISKKFKADITLVKEARKEMK